MMIPLRRTALLGSLIIFPLLIVAGATSGRAVNAGSTASYVAAADAKTIYAKNCAGCHGKDGHGVKPMRSLGQPDFGDRKWQKSVSDREIFEVISNGKRYVTTEGSSGYMPAWKRKLSKADIDGLVQLVREFGKK